MRLIQYFTTGMTISFLCLLGIGRIQYIEASQDKTTKIYIRGICYQAYGTHEPENIFQKYDSLGIQVQRTTYERFSPLYSKITDKKIILFEPCH